MSEITMADWACSLNNCRNPLYEHRKEEKRNKWRIKIPANWRTARTCMAELGIYLTKTDLNEWIRGEMSIKHLVNNLCINEQLNKNTKTAPTRNETRKVKEFVEWRRNEEGEWRMKAQESPESGNRHSYSKQIIYKLIEDCLKRGTLPKFNAGPNSLYTDRESNSSVAFSIRSCSSSVLSLTLSLVKERILSFEHHQHI